MHPDLKSTLVALEQSLHDPATRRKPEQVALLLSAGFREFGSSGRIWSRAATLQALTTEPPSSISSRDFALEVLSPILGLLTYTSSSGTRESLRSSLWRLEDGQWRILFHQGTPVP